jgi:hypothetical protein
VIYGPNENTIELFNKIRRYHKRLKGYFNRRTIYGNDRCGNLIFVWGTLIFVCGKIPVYEPN